MISQSSSSKQEPELVIANRAQTIILPWEPGLLEWLQAQYPRSGYEIYEIENEHLDYI